MSNTALTDQLKAFLEVANREGFVEAAAYLRFMQDAPIKDACDRFIKHVADRPCLFDSSHDASQGEASHYYELDAPVVDNVVYLLRVLIERP